MKRIISFIGAACFLLSSIFISCKKKDVAKPIPKPTCRIIKATIISSAGERDPLYFNYNSNGKLSSFSQGPRVTTFVYSGSTIIANTTSSGAFYSTSIITLNGSGLAVNVRTDYDTHWTNRAYEYRDTEVVKNTFTASEGDAAIITTYTWSGGNLTSITSGESISTFEYFTDIPAQEGDFWHLAQLQQGYEIYRTKNALKLSTAGSSFYYTLDPDEKITSVAIIASATAATFNYQYQCN